MIDDFSGDRRHQWFAGQFGQFGHDAVTTPIESVFPERGIDLRSIRQRRIVCPSTVRDLVLVLF
ncbi:hypothetical protein ACU4HD_35145 [Cupriavidus basilensis]